jgi:TolB protein
MRRKLWLSSVFATCMLGAMIVAPTVAHAAWWTQRQLTTDSRTSTLPAISGSHVVYRAQPQGNGDIYLYDLLKKTERRLTTNPADQRAPDVSGNKVVYQDLRNGTLADGNWDIYLYDLSSNTERRLTTRSSNQMNPRISGSKVVYEDDRYGDLNVFVYDMSTGHETRIPTGGGVESVPDISGDYVVWGHHATADTYGLDDDVCVYNLSTHVLTTIPSAGWAQRSPAISGTKVVYTDNRGGVGDVQICVYDINTGVQTQLTEVYWGLKPRISGNLVVYKDGETDTWLCDLATGIHRQLADSATDYSPDISGNTVVWQGYNSEHNCDGIFIAEPTYPKFSFTAASPVGFAGTSLASGTMLTATGTPIPDKQVSLQYSSDGATWTTYGSTLSLNDGTFALYSPALKSARYMKVIFAGDQEFRSARSASVLVKPKAYLTAPSTAAAVSVNVSHSAIGYLKPRHAAGSSPIQIKCYRNEKQANGMYRYILHKTVYAKAYDYIAGGEVYTRYKTFLSFPSKGSWSIRAYHAEDSRNAAAYSDYKYVTVR